MHNCLKYSEQFSRSFGEYVQIANDTLLIGDHLLFESVNLTDLESVSALSLNVIVVTEYFGPSIGHRDLPGTELIL